MIVATIIRLQRPALRPITPAPGNRALTTDEAALLDMYRAKSEPRRAELLRLSFQLANQKGIHEHHA